jgi:hypothetical protein
MKCSHVMIKKSHIKEKKFSFLFLLQNGCYRTNLVVLANLSLNFEGEILLRDL